MAETNNIYTSLINITKGVKSIGKGKKNLQQGYAYRGIDDMYNDLHDLFATHGVFITSEVVGSEREERTTTKGGSVTYTILDVKFSFHAIDGSCVSSTMKGEAMDSGDKSCNKAMSTALKYALMQMFLIPTEDLKDSDADTHEVEPKKKDPPKGQKRESPMATRERFDEEKFEKFKEAVNNGTIQAERYQQGLDVITSKYILGEDMIPRVQAFYNKEEPKK